MLGLLKRNYLKLYGQLRVRKNLYEMGDRRAVSMRYDRSLFEAASIWPEVLPWSPTSILDIGAHSGKIADQLSVLYRPVFMGLVEPLPELARALTEKEFSPRQRVFQCALGRTQSKEYMNVLSNLSSSSILQVTPEAPIVFNTKMDRVCKIEVQVRTLDDIFEECGLEVLDLLKIDVQGYEMEVFAGGNNTIKRTRLVVCEVSFFEHYHGQPLFKDIYSHLQTQGFEIRRVFGYVYDPYGMLIQCDVVFINKNMGSFVQP